MKISAAEARRAYKRKWAKEHPDKVRAQQERYWIKKAAELSAIQNAGNDGQKPEGKKQ